MTDYPGSVYTPRTKQNKAGIVYDETKTEIGYTEDITKLDDEVVAIETELGLNPKGTSADLTERIKGLRSLVDANADVIIIKGGSVGLGTSSPGGLLDMFGGPLRVWNGSIRIYVDTVPGNATFRLDTSSWYWRLENDRLDGNKFKIIDTTGGKTPLTIVPNTGNVGIGTTIPTALLDVNSDILRLRTAKTPATAGAAGNTGDICWDANYVYVCVATNTWKRAAISAW